MIRFLITFIVAYSLMNGYVLNKARFLFPDRLPTRVLLLCFLALMVLAPMGARLSERGGHSTLAHIFAFTGYPWMGFVFLAFWIFLLTDVVTLLAKYTGVAPALHNPLLKTRGAVAVLFGIVAMVFLYGIVEARSIRTERLSIATPKLPPGMHRLRIAQISDVHMGLIVGEGRLRSILKIVEEEKPDLLVATGDLVDGDIVDRADLFRQFQSLQPPLGKFAVTGNHEVYTGMAQSIEALRMAGFRILEGEAVDVGGVLTIAGVDDPARGASVEEGLLLGPLRKDRFVLLLKHRPHAPESSQGLFDLQLSGHTHRGQIFPFRFFTGLSYPMQDGLYHLKNGSKLYTSRGSGTWGPPIRVLSPPEVTIIDLVAGTG